MVNRKVRLNHALKGTRREGRRYDWPMPDNDEQKLIVPDASEIYANYLRTCELLGVEPVPRERAFGLIQEWSEALSRRPEPTTH